MRPRRDAPHDRSSRAPVRSERAERRPSSDARDRPTAADPQPHRESRRRPVGQLAAAARRDFEALTGRRVEAVSGVERVSDGYRVTFEVVEVERIPSSTNLMASYEVIVDGQGELVEFSRIRRYHRNQADDAAG